MRRLMTGFRNVQSNRVVTRCRPAFTRVASLLSVAGVLAFAPVFAEEPAVTDAKSTGKRAAPQAQAHPDSVVIPECLEKLKLSSKQQDQVKEIVRNYDQSLSSVWKQFSDRYMQTIAMESSLLAAIEDNLTETQRQQVRDQRRKTAQHEKTIGATGDKSNQATDKPANAVEDELAAVGVSLTSEQAAIADKVQEKYRSPMRSLNRDIQGLHSRLVSLEADKLVAIEKVLTKEQLKELRSHRQNAPEAPKLATRTTEATTE